MSADALRPPRQARSERSLRRILTSARAVLEHSSFEDATLDELLSGAGVTTGAFYARFAGKDALLDFLEQEAHDDLRTRFAEQAGVESPPVTVEEGIARFLTALCWLYREHRGVVRSILLSSRSDPDRGARRMRLTSELVGQGVTTILGLEGRIRHADPARAVRIALLFASSALRDAVLFDEDWATRDIATDALLVEELATAAVAYLTYPDPNAEEDPE
jgi:AcrR family transcriptional regulator